MSDIICKRCGSASFVRNGIVHGHQRYRCKSCACNFTMTPPKGKPASMKAAAVLMYAKGNMSFGAIGRLLGVSDVSVLRWVRAEARTLPEPEVGAGAKVVLIDEMWHFVKKSPPSSGSGGPMTLWPGAPSASSSADATTPPAKSSSTKSG